MSLKVGELEADVTLDDSKFERGIDQSGRKFDRFAKNLATEAEKGGAKAGTALGDGLEKGAGKGDKLGRLAKDLAKEAAKAGDKAGDELGEGLDRGLDKGRGRFGAFLSKLASDAGQGGKKAGAKLTDGLKSALSGVAKLGVPLAAAGIAAGALFLGGLAQAVEQQGDKALLASQLGLTEKQAEKSGKIAGDLYKNAFGDSIADVNSVLKTVFQSGIVGIKDSEKAIEGVTEKVMNYSKISEEEALPITRAVAQMLKTGIAKNADEAFDILVRGQQLGINKSEDLLDTFNEYSVQFKKIGLDGPTALGLMNQALQAGARDSDLAADALKEFSIRAIDGSKTTVDGFKSLKLNAKQMQEQIAKGGAPAAAGLDIVLDKLRAVKDPAERSRIAVELFGTQAEDLGAALFAMDSTTAVKTLGEVAGAAEKAGDTMNDTATGKITTAWRTIKQTIVDAIGTYLLPKLEEFTDWFNGPGKFAVADWGLIALQGLLTMSEGATRILGSILVNTINFGIKMTDIFAKTYGRLPGYDGKFEESKRQIEEYRNKVDEEFTGAADSLGDWNTSIDGLRTKIKFEADMADLDAKLTRAQKELKDPNLTKERRAKLTAEVKDLLAKKDAATTALADPKLTARKIAKFAAEKKDLDAKITAAKKALADPKLSATKKATLKAEIAQLLAAKKKAQDAINALSGKTVTITMKLNSANIAAKVNDQLARAGYVDGRAAGGPVTKGTPYVVGEHQPELFVPDENGTIIPRLPNSSGGGAYAGSSNGDLTVRLEVHGGSGDFDRVFMDLIRKHVKVRGGNVQTVFGR